MLLNLVYPYEVVVFEILCYLRNPGSVGLLNGSEDCRTRKGRPNELIELCDFDGKSLGEVTSGLLFHEIQMVEHLDQTEHQFDV